MEILAHCRIYPLSQYIKRAGCEINLDIDGITIHHRLGHVNRLVHVIEKDFRVSAFKRGLIELNVSEQGMILVIDIMSAWGDFSAGCEGVCVLNSLGFIHMDYLINFLAELNESPLETLKSKCSSADLPGMRIEGIIVDNISYYEHDNGSTGSYVLLLKMLNMIKMKFGCWIVSISYGIEYYEGVDTVIHKRMNNLRYPTLIPLSYLNEMDTILYRETASSLRQLK